MTTNQIYTESNLISGFFKRTGEHLELTQIIGLNKRQGNDAITITHQLPLRETSNILKEGTVLIEKVGTGNLYGSLYIIPKQLGCSSAAYIPILRNGTMQGVVFLGKTDGTFISQDIISAFEKTIKLTDQAEYASDATPTPPDDRQLKEKKAFSEIASAATTSDDLQFLYKTIHDQVRNVIGDYSIIIAIYDQETNSINIPYLYEEGNITSIETFPLGEGLTSILIRTGAPLMIVEDAMNRATALGAKLVGEPARSWLGVPLISQGKPIGAIIIQDQYNEFSFDDSDLDFMVALAHQASGTVNTYTILEQSRQTALQFETAAEIARDISSSLHIDELLRKAVDLIRTRFNFYHASVFLKDPTGEFVAIREATGDAGLQLKRAGHKLGIGSKSVVGFAAGNREQLIVNDTTRDATYYPNPLLPATRAEAAIPLIAGDRMVGVLDVQSTEPFTFSESNLRTLQILADQLAIAVVNTELFAETQEHLAQHRLLHHITTTAASGTTLDEALQSAVNGLQVTLGGDRVSILLADREKTGLEVKASVGYSSDIYELKISLEDGLTGWAAKHRRTVRTGNVKADTRYIEGSPYTQSELAIPLIYRSELLGVLNVESEQSNAYSESDEELLGTLGGSLAAIIANARLLEQIRSQAERERIIYEITDKIRRTSDMQTILTTTASELTRATGASRILIKLGTSEGSDNNVEASNDA